MKIKVPVRIADYKDIIIKYCGVKYAPFDEAGNRNMGYLFEINRELACFFIKVATRKNTYLLDLDYVQELMN